MAHFVSELYETRGDVEISDSSFTQHYLPLWPGNFYGHQPHTDYVMPLKARGPVVMEHRVVTPLHGTDRQTGGRGAALNVPLWRTKSCGVLS